MYSRTTRIVNETGLHARPASDFIGCASHFDSEISIGRRGSEQMVNAKSIIMLLTLGLGKDTEIEIRAKGTDEIDAVNALVDFVNALQG